MNCGGLYKGNLVPSEVQGEAWAQGCHQSCQEPKPVDLVKAVGQHLLTSPLLPQSWLPFSPLRGHGQGWASLFTGVFITPAIATLTHSPVT